MRAAGLALEQPSGSLPTPFDYLTWADACTVDRPDAPVRGDILSVRKALVHRAHRTHRAARTIDSFAVARNRVLGVLLDDARAGYPDLLHTMAFPTDAGFHPSSALQAADVFTRAIVLEVLARASMRGYISCPSILALGTDFLVRSRRRDAPGGWSYFPGLMELPGDLDTLSQVAMTFSACRRVDLLDAYVSDVFEHYCAGSRGSDFQTWIYSSQDSLASVQRTWAKNAWGIDGDAEVIAHAIHAMRTIDARRFADTIEKMQHYLVRNQAAGIWTSTWYHGPFYCAYVAARALTNSEDFASVTDDACRVLEESQRSDGGWGIDSSPSDALSTAYAVLALFWSGRGDDNYSKAGRAFLEACVDDGRFLAEVPFIRMNLGRAQHRDGPILSYASSTITAAYVAMALMCNEDDDNAFS
ncbi:MAG: prenyltransferase/squalene oxidase repeat-containing protein [Vulcanimicrobiaceae bacterium]